MDSYRSSTDSFVTCISSDHQYHDEFEFVSTQGPNDLLEQASCYQNLVNCIGNNEPEMNAVNGQMSMTLVEDIPDERENQGVKFAWNFALINPKTTFPVLWNPDLETAENILKRNDLQQMSMMKTDGCPAHSSKTVSSEKESKKMKQKTLEDGLKEGGPCGNQNCGTKISPVWRNTLGDPQSWRCNACYAYRNRFHCERPVRLCRRPTRRVRLSQCSKSDLICSNCDTTKTAAWRFSHDSWRCNACHYYWARYREERPIMPKSSSQ